MKNKIVIFTIIFLLIIILIVGVILRNKNIKELSTYCDETKQVEIVEKIIKEITSDIDTQKYNVRINRTCYHNFFIDTSSFDLKSTERLIMDQTLSAENEHSYIISIIGDKKTKELTVIVDSDDGLDTSVYRYKLLIVNDELVLDDYKKEVM